jgi:hypothetical protein
MGKELVTKLPTTQHKESKKLLPLQIVLEFAQLAILIGLFVVTRKIYFERADTLLIKELFREIEQKELKILDLEDELNNKV